MAAEVSGMSGIFKKIPMGETRWNRNATSGKAASQTTVEATMPSTMPAPTRRNALRHPGSKQALEVVERRARTEASAPDRLKNVSHQGTGG